MSYSGLKTLDFVSSALHTLPEWRLEKLVASGLPLSPATLEGFFRPLSERPEHERHRFHTLKLGSIPSTSTKAPGLTDAVLTRLMPYLETLDGLESVSLFQNWDLGKAYQPLSRFIEVVGRRCLVRLALFTSPHLLAPLSDSCLPRSTSISRFQSSHTISKLSCRPSKATTPTPPLRTSRRDCAASFSTRAASRTKRRARLRRVQSCGRCTSPRQGSPVRPARRFYSSVLAKADALRPFLRDAAKFLATVLNACPHLSNLNLTSCRGIPVVQRRTFFDAWDRGEVAVTP